MVFLGVMIFLDVTAVLGVTASRAPFPVQGLASPMRRARRLSIEPEERTSLP
jgi:hypothetical protein